MQGNELLVRHLVDLVHLRLSISSDEFLDDHETTTYTDDQLAVEDLCIDLLRAEQEETVSNFSNGNWTVRLVDVVAQHLIQQVTLWKLEHRSLLLITDLHVHYLDDLVLVFEESLHFLDLIDLFGNTLGKIIKSLEQNFLILSESLDVRIQSLDVSVQVRDLRLLELDLLVQINLLLPNDIQFLDLIVDHLLSLLQSVVDLFDLVFDFLDLHLRVFDHLVCVLDLCMQMIGQLLLLRLLEVLLE